MKVKNLEIFQNKRGLKECKWASLNTPGTESHLSHPIFGLEEFPFSIISPRGLKELASQYESEKVGKCHAKKWLKGMQMVQFECPRH